jgi:outer membrane lipoprotein-sorting protein
MKTRIALFLCVIALALGARDARAEEIPPEKAPADSASLRTISVTDLLPKDLDLEGLSPENAPPGIAKAVIEGMFDYMRGKGSFAKVEMTIHRPDWQRTMTIDAWTKGVSMSVFFITAPPKDNGNGTLKKDREMWMFNPKVNRVIKLPPSMMSQGWMGSDFSNNDIAKSDTLINDYDHTLESVEIVDGFKAYTIKSIPKPAAPVVWGMQKVKVRDDLIVLSQEYYDEDFELVKFMTTMEIRVAGDRLYPMVWRMQKADTEDEYTQLDYKRLEFMDDVPDNLFTLSNLKARRR